MLQFIDLLFCWFADTISDMVIDMVIDMVAVTQ